ncbi:MAG: alpha/beta hydrolase [Gammaproteobacteria bacterium]|nr:alpha/beta hydrolase [Gammaproteobacteria bacterium]
MFPKPAFVDVNGLEMAVHEQGDGDPVVLLHGFPELAYSWRHQLPALAAAGLRAIAPDQRGYGQTKGPANVADCRMQQLIADVHGLLDALELETATFIGHDWGALVLWNMAMLAPERIDRLVILNIPHFPRSPVDPVGIMRERFGKDFYIVNFQDSDEADRLFGADPRHFINRMMRKNQLTREQFEKLPPPYQVVSLLRQTLAEQASGDALLDDEELDYYTARFAQSGFTGPINWYRNWTHNWEQLEGVSHQIDIPTLFVGASNDVLIGPQHIEGMKPLVKDLTIHMLDCGHWTQQEKPDDVNRLVLEWLARP